MLRFTGGLCECFVVWFEQMSHSIKEWLFSTHYTQVAYENVLFYGWNKCRTLSRSDSLAPITHKHKTYVNALRYTVSQARWGVSRADTHLGLVLRNTHI